MKVWGRKLNKNVWDKAFWTRVCKGNVCKRRVFGVVKKRKLMRKDMRKKADGTIKNNENAK